MQNLQQKAEEALGKYTYNQDLQLSQVKYTNVRNVSEDLLNGMTYSPHFKQNVNMDESGVQIPIEIYEGCK